MSSQSPGKLGFFHFSPEKKSYTNHYTHLEVNISNFSLNSSECYSDKNSYKLRPVFPK